MVGKFRLPLIGALSLSAAASSSGRGGFGIGIGGTSAASAAPAANFTRRASFDGAVVAARRKSSSSLDNYSIGEQVSDKNFNRWNISGAAAGPRKAAFVSLSSPPPPRNVSTEIITAKKSANTLIGAGAASPTTTTSMKRASPGIAFASSALKRSFSRGSSPLTLSMSTSAAKEPEEASKSKQPKPMTRPPLYNFRNSFSHSWINHLSPEDPENLERSLSRRAGRHPGRPVFNGHYVSVRPTPLNNPKLVIHSPEVLEELGFHPDEAGTGPFVKYFSGDVDGAFDGAFALSAISDSMDADDGGMTLEKALEKKEVETWATPYALSIMGKRYTNNCPYGTGDGYGDGRAISVGEVLVPHSSSSSHGGQTDSDVEGTLYPDGARRYELQLKGAGQTPFCRGADGRAVLRSSIREFLASEAMHHLGISTTRALSLIVSDGPRGNTSTRPWYSDSARARDLPRMDDPRLAKYGEKQRREIISQLAAQAKSDPDMMMEEKCAITTRVARSFVRIGHLDLFARRVEMLAMKSVDKEAEPQRPVKETQQYGELEDMMWHACYREFHEEAYAPHIEEKDASGAALALMENSMRRIADMVGGWIRVGFVQGNFNADNCLVGGRTMDYGPFGFLDVYHPLSAKWTGSGEHFGFMNQPNAGYANFAVLVESLLPIIEAEGGDVEEVRDEVLKKAQSVFSDAVDEAMRSKMGLDGRGGSADIEKEADELWGELEPLLRTARGDWTIFWRQLTYVAAKYPPAKDGGDRSSDDYDDMVPMLLGDGNTNPFYEELADESRASLRAWIERWHMALTKCHAHDAAMEPERPPPEDRMRMANPKYTLREWMLVDAYTKADPGKSPGNPFPSPGGDYSGIRELFDLCRDPYGEGSEEMHEKYYRRAPDESLKAGGTAFMS